MKTLVGSNYTLIRYQRVPTAGRYKFDHWPLHSTNRNAVFQFAALASGKGAVFFVAYLASGNIYFYLLFGPSSYNDCTAFLTRVQNWSDRPDGLWGQGEGFNAVFRQQVSLKLSAADWYHWILSH
jgi:hypothetical protein